MQCASKEILDIFFLQANCWGTQEIVPPPPQSVRATEPQK